VYNPDVFELVASRVRLFPDAFLMSDANARYELQQNITGPNPCEGIRQRARMSLQDWQKTATR
jgi:hypothetical protein